MSQSDANQDEEFELCAKDAEPFGQYTTSNVEPTFVLTNSSENFLGLTGTSSYDHLSDKICANIGTQSTLVSEYDGLVSAGSSATLSQLGNAVDLVGNNIESMSTIATTSGVLGIAPDYNLTGVPDVAGISIASDNVMTAQGYIQSGITKLTSDPAIATETFLHSDRIATLNDTALNTAIFELPIAPTMDDRLNKIEKKFDEIKDEITELKIKKRQSDIDEAEEEISSRLEKINPQLKSKFIGAVQSLNTKNEDYIAQSAESLTRIIEKLPFELGAEVDKDLGKKDQITKALVEYLGVEENHYLVTQQSTFYSTLSSIRHGNEDIYPYYVENPSKYKALVLQVESYIYTILTFNDVK